MRPTPGTDAAADAREGARAAGLRILLAHDLSPAGDRATALIARATWPGGTLVRVVSSPIGLGDELSSFGTVSQARARIRQVQTRIALAHERVADELLGAGLSVETTTIHGRPERAVLADAERFAADVIVVGARNQSSIEATLLGSVSRAVVEGARCSVLVARHDAVSRVLLAVDGSAPARVATAIVAAWPLLARIPTRVVGVGDDSPAALRGLVDETVEGLAAPTREVDSEIRLGDAGTEIVAAAQAWAADLVAMGAHGQPFLRRVLLGSVTRKVVDGVPSSVLVARPGRATDAD